MPQDVVVGKLTSRALAEFPMNVPQLDLSPNLAVHPLHRIPDALGRKIRSGQDVAYAVLLGELVHRGEEGIILLCVPYAVHST